MTGFCSIQKLLIDFSYFLILILIWLLIFQIYIIIYLVLLFMFRRKADIWRNCNGKERTSLRRKSKKSIRTENPDYCIVSYKDDATAFNGEKKGTIIGKGVVNNRMSNFMFQMLEKDGIPTDFVEELNDRDTVLKKVEIVPLEVIVRNKAAGSLSKRLGLPEGTPMKTPVLEFCYKNDDLGDPMVNEYHILAAGFATKEEIDTISKMALRINELMVEFFKECNVDLIDFKLNSADTKVRLSLQTKFHPIHAVSGI